MDLAQTLAPLDRPNLQETVDRMDLAGIEAAMLWPDDDAYREKVIQRALILRALETPESLDREMAINLLGMSVGIPSAAEINAETETRHLYGGLAGCILAETIARIDGNMPLSMGEIINRACKSATANAGGWRKAQITPKTVQNRVWRDWKPVAHLWAAYNRLYQEHGKAWVWPCPKVQLTRFLGEAEAWRAIGETLKPRQSDTTVLPAGIAVRIPGSDRLPRVKLEFVPK
ncbi:hypothetical protein [Rhodovulum sp. PH10]|uniref:hypothetical protein n=1 Tax=Rhodovulum sp. PH10 TaxID=1187851 RepID=UPI00059082C1|nr:hypothetical protein [Rhodovulum sp. PH10]